MFLHRVLRSSVRFGAAMIIVLAAFSSLSAGQFLSAVATIDGLTCSMCSRSVEKSIQQLDFIESVEMDLNTNQATVVFKDDLPIKLESISKKIEDAGFSLREFQVWVQLPQMSLENYAVHRIGNYALQFVNVEKKEVEGKMLLKLVGNEFMCRKKWKEWKKYCSDELRISSIGLYPGLDGFYYVTI